MNGRIGIYYQAIPGLWGRAETLFASQQTRLAKGDKEDNRIGASGTPGWWITNLNMGYVYKRFSISTEFHNIFNKAYKTHGSGVYEMGRSIWVALTVSI